MAQVFELQQWNSDKSCAIWLLSNIREEEFSKSSSDFQLNAISWIVDLASTAKFLNVQEKIDAALLYQL